MRLIGTSLYDVLQGGSGDDQIFGLDGSDTIKPGTGRDVVFAGAGNDYVATDEDTTGDVIFGGAGNDSLWGASGHDRIFGGAGLDNIYGRGGNDVMAGGEGADLFYFVGSDEGTDIILDFEHGVDRLNIDPATATFVDLGSMIRVDYDAGSVILADISDPDQLTAGDFYFQPPPVDPTDLVV